MEEEGGGERDIRGVSVGRYRVNGMYRVIQCVAVCCSVLQCVAGKSWMGEDMSGSPLQ